MEEEWNITDYFSEKELSLIERLSPDNYQKLLKEGISPFSLFKFIIPYYDIKEGENEEDVKSIKRIVDKCILLI